MTLQDLLEWLRGLRTVTPTDPIREKYSDYLIQWRTSLWASIRHKELIIWSFIGFYATASGIILGAGRQYISPLTEVLAVTLLSFLGIHVVLDANSWNARNLFSISRIERKFIGEDAGALIPASYLDPKFRFNRIFSVQTLFIASIPALSYFRYAWRYLEVAWTVLARPPLGGALAATVVVLAFLLLVRRIGDVYRQNYYAFRGGFDREIDGAAIAPITVDELHAARLNDPTWIISAVGVTLILALFDLAVALQTRASWLLYSSITLLMAGVLLRVGIVVRRWLTAQTVPASLLGTMDRNNWILLVGSLLVAAFHVAAYWVERGPWMKPLPVI